MTWGLRDWLRGLAFAVSLFNGLGIGTALFHPLYVRLASLPVFFSFAALQRPYLSARANCE